MDVSASLGSFRIGKMYYKDLPHYYESCDEEKCDAKDLVKSTSDEGL
jgi:hypothetical protein